MSSSSLQKAASPSTLHVVGGVELGRILRGSAEFAVIDLRDEKDFGTGGPLYGNNIGIAALATELPRLVPRPATIIVLVDSDGSRLEEAGRVTAGLGYTNVLALKGGLDGNERLPVLPIRIAGPRIISGEVERAFGTPVVTPREVAEEEKAGKPVAVFDTRSFEEYARAHVPGSHATPGGEILAYFHQLVSSPDTHVVVTCAGRSRAVLGAQTLIDAGVPNRVSQLDFGTHGWRDEGLELETGFGGAERPAAADIAYARSVSERLHSALPRIDAATLATWLVDESRTTYALDVRLPDVFEKGHLPGSVSAPGGQLGITIGKWVAVQGARLVLIDDRDGFRAATTGHWFKRLGWDVSILQHDFT